MRKLRNRYKSRILVQNRLLFLLRNVIYSQKKWSLKSKLNQTSINNRLRQSQSQAKANLSLSPLLTLEIISTQDYLTPTKHLTPKFAVLTFPPEKIANQLYTELNQVRRKYHHTIGKTDNKSK